MVLFSQKKRCASRVCSSSNGLDDDHGRGPHGCNTARSKSQGTLLGMSGLGLGHAHHAVGRLGMGRRRLTEQSTVHASFSQAVRSNTCHKPCLEPSKLESPSISSFLPSTLNQTLQLYPKQALECMPASVLGVTWGYQVAQAESQFIQCKYVCYFSGVPGTRLALSGGVT